MSAQPLPFVAISSDELARGTVVHAGDRVRCPICGQPHALSAPMLPLGNGEDARLLFYACGEASYLVALDGHLIDGLEIVGDG